MTLVGVTAFIMGLVLTIQSRPTLVEFGAESYLPSMVSVSLIREIAPVITALICAGKIGSGMGAELGSMRVTEQIDALEIMGVNSLNHLVLPKIMAAILFFPILIIFSMALSMFGGWMSLMISDLTTTETYVLGLRAFFNPFHITYALTKTVVFGFLIVSISSFYGYYVKGGSINVGRASTQAVVSSSIAILIANFILTQLLLLS